MYANPWLAIREDTVRRSDGSTGTYTVVDSADIVLIVPVDGDRLHLVEQYRHPVGGRRCEFPSGRVDERGCGRSRGSDAKLREETGILAGGLVPLGTLDVTPSTMSQAALVSSWASGLTAGTWTRADWRERRR